MRMMIRGANGGQKVVSLAHALREWMPRYPSVLETPFDVHERLYQDSTGGFYVVTYEGGVPKSGEVCLLERACAWLVYHGYPIPPSLSAARLLVDVDRVSVLEPATPDAPVEP